ncbi:DUF4340 domain-containing protein [Pseudohaliea rubra]|uniref:DUF4340 domain-containing protein n=1 Tax=Pseudohaliea rubra DSM 19751 TaxID=1265313 RepID=A0A095VRQ9_9GAMM|nr:DUF4340 domain-containing protein [Pseudohaliea rubra]KGE04055.1 hypothetical protein HRUBRA_01279 [Pseudohaliea rubra DSM 19751]
MNRFLLPGLAMLLALQLLVAATVYWPATDDNIASALPLLRADVAASADGLRISDDEGAAARLIRTDDGWALAASGLPVAPGRVATLLSTLEADPGWPMAQSASARERFAVDEEAYERRIELLSGEDVLATVFLGSAPGFRQVYAREAGSEAIYSIDFNAYDAPTDDSGWLDRGLAAIPAPSAVRWDGHRLESGDDGWRLDGSAVEDGAADDLVRALEGLQVTAVAEAPPQAAQARTLAVRSGGQAIELTFVAEDEAHFLKSSDWAPWFMISRYDHDRIVDSLGALTGGGGDTAGETGEEAEAIAPEAATP